ncbi:nitroreductase family deazaflavin-dependent oxidoreductase [Mycobacterium sp. E2497]|uniref:nitroreductase family deazaflavin-dependent oxidoreductase n=1 Tax=Mycobacterium sp. E2497 TaxID=1834135 RepID=UPI0009EF252A|nr:nitroreductase family deazaflavin-dependent oxidoreductase [Mycobacterium sp. E2497]
MPAHRSLARFNRRATNRVVGQLAPWLPGFGVVVHTGRNSKREYRTPVNVFRVPDGYVIALPFGPEADWVRNVIAAGGCELRVRGGRIKLASPELFHDEQRRHAHPVVRGILRFANVTDFLRLRFTSPPTPAAT